MKVLFIVQGEGRGHLTQAITLEEILRRNGHEVVEVLVGKSNTRRLPGFFNRSIQAPVKRFLSPNFLPTPANKRVSMSRSIAYNLMQVPAYLRSICYIHRRIHETDADLVINFYELLTGLTYLFFRPSVPQISVGHQYLFLHHDFEFPQKNPVSLLMLRFFTRLTCIGAKEKLALSFRPMETDEEAHIRVVPPLLRNGTGQYPKAAQLGVGTTAQGMDAQTMLDYMGIIMDTEKLQNRSFTINLKLTDGDDYLLKIHHGVLLYYKDALSDEADLTISTPRIGILAITSGNQENIDKLITVEKGDKALFQVFCDSMAAFDLYFNIIEP